MEIIIAIVLNWIAAFIVLGIAKMIDDSRNASRQEKWNLSWRVCGVIAAMWVGTLAIAELLRVITGTSSLI